jgi:FemAB-related protein (PEP-CTERM system-associated)
MRGVRIETVGPEAATHWDAYVERAPAGTIFHRFGWGEAVAAGLGQEPLRLAARRDGQIVGVLPLVHKRSPLFGDALISVAFATYGGIVAEDAEAAAALEDAALALGAARAVRHVELRDHAPVFGTATAARWRIVDGVHATFRAPIAADDGAALRAIPRKGRRHDVKRSLKAGLDFVADASPDEFHAVLAESYRNLGTPIFAAGFLRALHAALPEHCRVFLVRRGAQALAGCLAFLHKGAVHPFYAGGTAGARAAGANDFLYFNLMRHARAAGIPAFDFGRSRLGSGSHAYKRSWGFAPRPLAYRFAMTRGGEPPRLDPDNPKFRLMIAAWKLLPLPVANRAGPWIARQLG